MTAKKTRVILLYGGRSSEHEVSLLSARNVFAALDRDRFEPFLIGIDKAGVWRRGDPDALMVTAGDPRTQKLKCVGDPIVPPPWPQGPDESRALFNADDVVFPVLHGSFGEDGTLQGLLDMMGLAYVGAGTLGSALAMDKDVAKRVAAAAGVPVVPWVTVFAHEHKDCPDDTIQKCDRLGWPLFVKPANAGSSVGVHKANDGEGLLDALSDAFRFDHKVVVEAAVNAREIECAVLGHDKVEATKPGEVIVTHPDGFYSYDAKYVDAEGARVEIEADLDEGMAQAICDMAKRTFAALELSGLARIDFFLDKNDGSLFLNEANTLPGFTAISMYPKMWEAAGVGPTALISRLVDAALQRHASRKTLSTCIEPLLKDGAR